MNNHVGEKYGRLQIIGCERKANRTYQKCLCACGNVTYVPYYKLLNGHTKSCGCLKNKYDIKNKRLFNCWTNMKSRCDTPHRKDSKYYHDKGITYCEEWKKYENFQDWALANGYENNLTLDRIDTNKPYCPQNCRWITIAEQQRNRSCCRHYTLYGETKTLSEWAREKGINEKTLRDRIDKLGYSFEEAISNKRIIPRISIVYEVGGQKYTENQFSKMLNTSRGVIRRLRDKGYTANEIKEKFERT